MHAVFYHGVVDRRPGEHYYSSIFRDRRAFEADVDELARRWKPMSLAEIDAHHREGFPLPARAVHISFDDGFANTLEAAEILERRRVPWTLFVVVDALLDRYRPWFVRVANALGETAYVRRGDGSIADLTTATAKWRFANELKARIMTGPASRHEELVGELLRLPGVQAPSEEPWTLLGLDAVRELHRAGVEIGNHSARHVNLNRCDAATLAVEVEGSRRRLENALGAPVRWFAYPDGRYGGRVVRAASIGHDLATSVWRPGARGRRMAIPRQGSVGRLEPVRVGDVLDWARGQAPVKVRELRHRLAT